MLGHTFALPKLLFTYFYAPQLVLRDKVTGIKVKLNSDSK